jgi:hypothetical protein
MPRTKYGKYVSREIIKESKYSQITSPIARYDGCPGGGNALSCEWSCITKPFVMDAEPEVDKERDQFLLFVPGNIDDPKDFHAEIEIPIGKEGKKQRIDEPTVVYIPRGLVHGPVKFKTIGKPMAFLSCYFAPEYSVKWEASDESKYLVDLNKQVPFLGAPSSPDDPPDVQAIHPPSTPFRYIRMPMGKGLNYMLWGERLGFPAKASWSYGTSYYREYVCMEPVHAHRRSHQISMYLGSNPLDIEDFDADIEIYMGKEHEKHVIDTCAVDHYVPGIPHIGDEIRRVGKPYIHIMWVIGPDMNDYYKAVAADKVLLSDESKGEVMITKGAHDYVPPTKLEDWVWPYPNKKK